MIFVQYRRSVNLPLRPEAPETRDFAGRTSLHGKKMVRPAVACGLCATAAVLTMCIWASYFHLGR
ncbi:hypothetical protein AGR3A_Cc280018 [Agrobacterium tomkonis CFBP 6623]|uniref:Transmembrane protein n=1 Tax=Agrobacterium tomkonis CFBP 6623 TaxID=1183432 RepID=A0A1S7PPD6_9HYPH|nr:hypothetical protein AGR3A_Cc280018 [Agrobacterium tomkonis CFBP 6623]